ncbi:MAG: hypothetical protein Q4B60_08200 [Erysipelotrichaceae bacterium]|nr:hypothetical protein [Erysipelotrichaceae bacterium]
MAEETVKKRAVKKKAAPKKKENVKETESTVEVVAKPRKKKTTAKKTSAAKKRTTKKKENVVEVIPEEIKEEVIVEEVPVEETAPVIELEEEKVTVKKSSTGKLLVLALVIIALVMLYGSMRKTKVNIKDICSYYPNETGTMTLPANWEAANDGFLFRKEGNVLVNSGMVLFTGCTEEEFNEFSYGEEEIKELDTKPGYIVKRIDTTYNEDAMVYLIIYKDGTAGQICLINSTEAEVKAVLDGINY